jgi:hypothetical protein
MILQYIPTAKEILYVRNIVSADSLILKYARNADHTLPQCMLWICLLKVTIKPLFYKQFSH